MRFGCSTRPGQRSAPWLGRGHWAGTREGPRPRPGARLRARSSLGRRSRRRHGARLLRQQPGHQAFCHGRAGRTRARAGRRLRLPLSQASLTCLHRRGRLLPCRALVSAVQRAERVHQVEHGLPAPRPASRRPRALRRPRLLWLRLPVRGAARAPARPQMGAEDSAAREESSRPSQIRRARVPRDPRSRDVDGDLQGDDAVQGVLPSSAGVRSAKSSARSAGFCRSCRG
jgi:hypothetical protein